MQAPWRMAAPSEPVRDAVGQQLHALREHGCGRGRHRRRPLVDGQQWYILRQHHRRPPWAGSGLAIFAYGTLAVSNCIFTDNDIYGFGGAIYSSGAATISSSSFSGNSAIRGGAILNAGRSITVSDCTPSDNSASGSGGGIYNSGKLTVSDSVFSDNSPDNIFGKYTDKGGNTFR